MKAPSEEQIQRALVEELRLRGLLINHSPLESMKPKHRGAQHGLGAEAGWPDLLIYDSPASGEKGLALELKARDRSPSDVTDAQREKLEALEERGWRAGVCFGLDQAQNLIDSLYG